IPQADVRVTGGRQYGFTIEFLGGHAGTDVAGLQVSTGGVSGVSITKTATGTTNQNAIGLIVDDFTLGMALMTPTNPLEAALGVKYFSLKGSLDEISFVGVSGLTVDAERLSVEFNWSAPVFYGFPLFPVVDYANTPAFASEELALFDQNVDGSLTRGDLATLNQTNGTNLPSLSGISTIDTTPADHTWLLEILDVNNDGLIDNTEAGAVFSTANADATVKSRDLDSDGKIDPPGYELSTGAQPVYLEMDSMLARAQGYVNLDVFGVVTFTGSFAFELGPTRTDDLVSTVLFKVFPD
ncbi:MAG: hypothetical protein ACK5YO_16975, partial [Planctomyces sp.]